MADTPGPAWWRAPWKPRSALPAGKAPEGVHYDAEEGLLWVRVANQAVPRELAVQY